VQILPVPAPVGHADRQLSEERLAGFAPVPVAAVKGVLELEVEIRLARAGYTRGGGLDISREVTGLAEVFSNQPDRVQSLSGNPAGYVFSSDLLSFPILYLGLYWRLQGQPYVVAWGRHAGLPLRNARR